MKKGLLLLIFLCILLCSCTHKKIAFNKRQWIKGKNRYYMVDSLCEKLNAEKLNRSEIVDFLGDPKLERTQKDTVVYYWLKSEGFLTVWILYIYFDEDGNFISAEVVCED